MNQKTFNIIILIMAIVCFILGIIVGSSCTRICTKESVPKWYQEKIMTYTPGDVMKGTIPVLKESKPKELKETIVKEPHEQLQPKLYKLKKGYKKNE